MAEPATFASLAGIALLLADKILARCDCYSGVRTLHFGCSKCLQFDVERNSTPRSLSAATAPPTLTMPDLEGTVRQLREISARQLREVLAESVQPAQVSLVEKSAPTQ
jgi:hypothetical protein